MSHPASAKTLERQRQQQTDSPSVEPSRKLGPAGPYAGILGLQRAAGNQSVGELLRPYLGTPSPVNGLLQRKCAACTGSSGQCAQCKEEEKILQRKAVEPLASSPTVNGVPSIVHSTLNSGGGQPLDPDTRAFMESRFDQDFGHVRVHVYGRAAESARALNALAYTLGHNVVFGVGQYMPGTVAGKRLLAHELAHVMQQGRTTGSVGMGQAAHLEAEAETAAGNAVQGVSIPTLTTAPVGIHRAPDNKSPAESPDPIDDSAFPDYGWFLIGPTFFLPPKLDDVTTVLVLYGGISADVLRDSKRTLITRPAFEYWSFRHPTLGIVARVSAGKAGWSADKGDLYGFYLFRPTRAQTRPGAAAKPTTEGEGTTPAPSSSTRTGTTAPTQPAAQGPTSASKAQSNADKLAKLKALSSPIKTLLGGEQNFKPENYDQLLRISAKLQQLGAQDLELYKMLVTHLTKDLDAFEQSIDVYIRMRDQYRAELEARARERAKQVPRELTLQEKLAKTWEGFDEKKFATLNTDQKEAIARDVATKQRNIQLEHMATHPGETAAGMVEGVVRVDQVATGIYQDVKEAASGDKSSFARWAGGVGATGKLSGWIAGVAAIAYVALLFVPGVNVAVLAQTALIAGAAAVVLSGVESELRIKAAAEAKSTEEFKTQTQKAAEAQTNAIVGAALLALGMTMKLIARIPLPGRLQTVGNALKLARTALLESSGAGAALEAIRTKLLNSLKGAKQGLPEALAKEAKALADTQKLVEGMTGDQVIEKLVSGDETLQDLTNMSPETAKQIQDLAKTPAGKGIAEQFRQSLLKALQDAPGQAGKQLQSFLNTLDESISAVEKAQNAQQLKAAVDTAEKHLSPEEMGKQAQAEQQSYIKEKVGIERFKGKTDPEVKAAGATDPTAVDEVIRRYELKSVAELEKLSKAGDGTADYVLGKRRSSGYRKPAELPLRPSNLAVLDRLKAHLAKTRSSFGTPKEGSAGGTFGVAETDLPLQKNTFEGGSPKTGATPDPTYKPPTTFEGAQGHAEQNLTGAIKKAIVEAKLTPEQIKGKTVYMLIEQEVCSICKAGLYNESMGAGVLKQFSLDFPNITVEVMNVQTGEVLRFRGGSPVK